MLDDCCAGLWLLSNVAVYFTSGLKMSRKVANKDASSGIGSYFSNLDIYKVLCLIQLNELMYSVQDSRRSNNNASFTAD